MRKILESKLNSANALLWIALENSAQRSFMDRVGKLSTTLSMDRVVECKFYREICRNSDGFILRSKYIYKFTLELLKVDINCFH
ncbi:hypothetical protein LEP1GSC077_1514 [Leptospira interrogans str. C10069]|nr:hypothetical protein LEP1GSC077_1514 [Leptospira interrogans str. C10069]